MAMDLRPLTLGELLDRAFTLYRRNLWLFVGIMAVPSAFGLVFNIFTETINRMVASPGGFPAAMADPDQAVMVIATMVAGMLLAMVAYFIVYAVALGAMTLAVSELYQERTTSIGEVYRRMRPRLGGLVWLMLGIGIRVGLVGGAGIVAVTAISTGLAMATSPIVMPLMLLPGLAVVGGLCLFMVLRWGVAVPALVLEDRGARDAIRRSIELTRGRLGRVFLLAVCASIITYAALMLFQGPFLAGAIFAGPDTMLSFWLTIVGMVAGTIGATFTGPIMIVGLALLYYDARVREEGLDLQMMMAALDQPAAQLARG